MPGYGPGAIPELMKSDPYMVISIKGVKTWIPLGGL
jgi:hypothetical protein